MEEKLSVIVPCYNVEVYIEKIVRFLTSQTYKNIEIIMVDDCSTDNTYEKIKEFRHIKNLKILKNTENRGTGFARNRGIEISTGKYIGFIDPDDRIDSDYFEILVNKMKESNAEIVVTDMISVEEENEKNFFYTSACAGPEISKYNLINNGMAASACNKLYKREVIEKYPFIEGKINEDVGSILPAIINSKKVDYTDKTKYYYIQRKNSTQNSNITEKRLDMFEAVKRCLNLIKNNRDFQKYKDSILYHQIFMLYVFVMPKQKNFFKRYKILRKFILLQEEYKLYENENVIEFLEEMSNKDRKYFIKLVECLKNKKVFCASFFMGCNNLKQRAKKYVKLIWKRILKPILKFFLKPILKFFFKPKVLRYKISMDDLIKKAKSQKKKKQTDIKISVVIPNYNYEKFLIKRLYSILNQTEKIYEIIILDDNSSDDSKILIDELVNKINKYVNITKKYNSENTGSAFKQWAKGFKLAKGDYVWIAEADDYCSKYLLRKILKPIRNNQDKNIYISYADTAFINEFDEILLKTIKPEIDLRKTGHWNKNFINLGKNEITNYCFLNCTIANVSSCIIKNDNYDEIFKEITKYKQAGDWLFYINVINKGYISYIDKPLNYYRVHGSNITSTMKKQEHLNEIKRIHKEMYSIIDVIDWHEKEFMKRYKFLEKVWELNQ